MFVQKKMFSSPCNYIIMVSTEAVRRKHLLTRDADAAARFFLLMFC